MRGGGGKILPFFFAPNAILPFFFGANAILRYLCGVKDSIDNEREQTISPH